MAHHVPPAIAHVLTDARLIVSVHDLLAALKILRLEAGYMAEQLASRGLPGVPGDSVDQALLAADAAIAKATVTP